MAGGSSRWRRRPGRELWRRWPRCWSLPRMIRRLIGNLVRRRRAEASLDAELRAYVQDLTDRNLSKGMPRDLAHRQALVDAGGIEQIKEDVRDVWLGRGM